MMAGVWHQALAKSLVWYNTKEFEAAGYEIPETYDELLALSDQMVEDGVAPGPSASKVNRQQDG